MTRRFARLAAVVWAVAIAWLATRPGDELPEWPLPGLDKVAHAVTYLVLALLVRRAASAPGAALAIAVSLVHGAAIELAQMRVPGRSAEWLDLVADGIGAVVGAYAGARQSPQTRT